MVRPWNSFCGILWQPGIFLFCRFCLPARWHALVRSMTVCLFSLLILRRQNGDLAASKRFLLQAGILTGVLLIDDIFLFHEEVAPSYLHIGENL